MKKLNEYNIEDIENMPEADASDAAEEMKNIKGYTVYFVNFGGYFGYSALVYKNGHQIKYANDYQLHHPKNTVAELRELYFIEMENKLFFESELLTVESYDDYKRKQYFVMNLYPLQYDNISLWFCGSDEEREKLKKQIEKMFYSEIAFAYFYEPEIVSEISGLWSGLQEARKKHENDFEYMKSAFLYEMFNHEYGINWQADYDVISCFANVNSVKDYENINSLFEAAKFSETQKSAYMAARRDYFKSENSNL